MCPILECGAHHKPEKSIKKVKQFFSWWQLYALIQMYVLPWRETKQEPYEPKKGTKMKLLQKCVWNKWIEIHCFQRNCTKSKKKENLYIIF